MKKKTLRVDIVTIFPEMVEPYLSGSMLGRGQTSGVLDLRTHQLRDWTHDTHKTVDDKPFGGGPGMVMKVAPFHEALMSFKLRTKDGKKTAAAKKARVVLTSAKGKIFTQADARRLSKYDRLVFLCGRYEGVDERVAEHLADEELSIGAYVLTGGELPALVMTDAVARHIPGVLGKGESLEEVHGSFPQYTRPEEYFTRHTTRDALHGQFDQTKREARRVKRVMSGWKVPEILLSGNHKKIEEWRREKSKHV